jgi:hypothetical protein
MHKERKPPMREPDEFEPVIREPQDQGGGGSQQGGGGIPPNQRGHSPDMRPGHEHDPGTGTIGGVTDAPGEVQKQRGGQVNAHAGEQTVGAAPKDLPQNHNQRLAQRYELDREIRNERKRKPQVRGKRR